LSFPEKLAFIPKLFNNLGNFFAIIQCNTSMPFSIPITKGSISKGKLKDIQGKWIFYYIWPGRTRKIIQGQVLFFTPLPLGQVL